MQALGQQPQRGLDGAPVHYERHRPEQTALYRLVQQHDATFFEQAEDAAGADLPQFVKDEFDAFLECGILAHHFLRLRCGDCGHDKLIAFSCRRRGFCPSCGARRMAQAAAHLMDHVTPHVPVRQWVLSLSIPLRLLLDAQPKLVAPMLLVVHRVITRHLLGQAGLKSDEADSSAITLTRRFGSATTDARFTAAEALQLLTDAETAQRGHLITSRERYLLPYEAAIKALLSAMATTLEVLILMRVQDEPIYGML